MDQANVQQKRKASAVKDDGEQPVTKKAKAESKPAKAPRKEKPAREKKTPAKPRKSKRDDSASPQSTPAASSVDRRRSGRGASARKSYADRDDSEDDEEMWEGVAEWEYLDENGRKRPVANDKGETSELSEAEEEAKNEFPQLRKGDDDEDMDIEPTSGVIAVNTRESEDEEVTPPPKPNGKKTLPTKMSRRGAVAASSSSPGPTPFPPAPKAKPRVTASKPIVRAKGRGAAPISKSSGKEKEERRRGGVKGKEKEKKGVEDVFDLDDSD